jgi:hypothetical protein
MRVEITVFQVADNVPVFLGELAAFVIGWNLLLEYIIGKYSTPNCFIVALTILP